MLTWKAEADTASKATTTTVKANDLCRTAETFRGNSNGYNMQPRRAAKSRNGEGCTHHIAVWPRNNVVRSQPLSASLNDPKLQQSTKQVSTLKLYFVPQKYILMLTQT